MAPEVVLRRDVVVVEPLAQVRAFLEAYGAPRGDALPGSFGEADLREANRGGARISASEIVDVLARRAEIAAALDAISPRASLTARRVPWVELTRLFEAFGGIKGVGFSKMTKTLHPKRPALVPMLDSVVQRHLLTEAPPAGSFGERTTELVRAYKDDLDRNREALRELRRELAALGYRVTEVRILDVLIWSASSSP